MNRWVWLWLGIGVACLPAALAAGGYNGLSALGVVAITVAFIVLMIPPYEEEPDD